jgi:tRNA (cmo5U34)-methyltransferase
MALRDFDKDAVNWDNNPARVKLTSDIARALVSHVKLRHDMEVLDFGCGTGLLTLFVAPFVKNVMALDGSRGMLDVLNKKIAHQKTDNVTAMYWDITATKNLPGKYHLITSAMAMHHVEDVLGAVTIFYNYLLPGGILAMADLDLDKGRFHEDKSGVFHNGFDREKLKVYLKSVGFHDVHIMDAAAINKPVADKIEKFKIFLAVGEK